MVVPDFELICEIMLVAEGFLEARLLARKFITLYSLCKELLSKQVMVFAIYCYINTIFSCCMAIYAHLCGENMAQAATNAG